MAGTIVVIRSDGTPTLPPMEQTQAERYLVKLIEANRQSSLKQAFNDVTSGKGKPTGSYMFNGHPVLHASAGVVGGACVSLFYYDADGIHYIIAMGEHTDSTTYRLSDYGQESGNFRARATIELS